MSLVNPPIIIIVKTKIIDVNGSTRAQATVSGVTISGDIVGAGATFGNVEVGLANFQSTYTIDLALLSAASASVMVPSVLAFVFLRRRFVEGIATSGMKE